MDILADTLETRLKLFLKNIEDHPELYHDVLVNDIICHLPIDSQLEDRRYNKFRIGIPVRYGTNAKYRIKLYNHIYELYKNNCAYYLISTPNWLLTNKALIDEFTTTPQFSVILLMIIKILEELKEQGITVEMHDYVFTDFTKPYHTDNGDMKFYFTWQSIPDREYTNNTFYLSLFY